MLYQRKNNPNSKRLISILIVCTIIIAPKVMNAQNLDDPLIIDPSSIENTANLDFSQWLEQREELLQNPLQLHKLAYSILRQSEIFSEQQIYELLEHIKTNGSLLSLYELQVIPSFNLTFIEQILPYIQLRSSIDDYQVPIKQMLTKGTHELFFRYYQSFPQKKGFQTNNYIGRPNQLFLRYKYHFSNKMYYGLTGEKDAGEQFFGPSNKTGFDFYSGYFFWRINKKVEVLALGDYHLNLGQGLVLFTGFGFNKTSNVCGVKKESTVLKPYTSINEYAYMRGAALSLNLGKFSLTPFVSIKNVDASTSYLDSTNQSLQSNRIQTSGYHRTASEIENKHKLLEIHNGLYTSFKYANYHIGLSLLNTHYSDSIKFTSQHYNQFQFQGKNLSHTSLDYHWILPKVHFFGESALSISSHQKGLASLNGLIFHPSKILDFSLVHRYYSPRYQASLLTNAFAESTSPINEHGFYLGVSIKPNRHFIFASYLDYYSFPWLRYQTTKPSQGYDLLISAKYKPSKTLECYINYKREVKEGNTTIQLNENNAIILSRTNRPYFDAYFTNQQVQYDENSAVLRPSASLSKQELETAKFITPLLNQRLRLHLSYSINSSWTIQSRLECSFIKDQINSPSRGILLYQDLKFKSTRLPFGFSTRISLFDIRQFANRIYSYESDVLHQFSIPSFFNAGMRYYFNFQYQMSKNIKLWLRFSHTYYKDINSKGTGNNEINSNKLYDIKLQIRLKF
ncbi:MAG: hypothetical protein ACI9AB_001895 [Urechidicola sp.]|jgi:hypothetical protein